jgi:uncharacterized OB-fold protein
MTSLDRPQASWPLADLTQTNRDFWTGGSDGALHIARCRRCATFLHPPAPVCWSCYSQDIGTAAVSGLGTVYSFTVNHQSWDRGTSGSVYAIAVVELDEQSGLRVLSNVVGCVPEMLHIGARVRVGFRPEGEMFIPVFELIVPTEGTSS